MDIKNLNMQQRQTAYPLWIADVLSGTYVVGDRDAVYDAFTVRGKNIVRVNLMGTAVDSYINQDGSFGSLTIDDGTGTIRVKAFKEDLKKLGEAKRGDLVNCLGLVKEYNDERYMTAEVVRVLGDPYWLLFRMLTLSKQVPLRSVTIQEGHQPTQDQNYLQEETPRPPAKESSSPTKQLLTLITSVEEGISLVDLEQKLAISRQDLMILVDTMVNEGEIYQFKPGHYKRL